jgi:hypothetical protein
MASIPLHPKAELPEMTQFFLDRGVTVENSEMGRADFNYDTMAAAVYTPENSKKSEDFFLEIMGVR